MRRFINFYDEQERYICGRAYYFDQCLAYESNPKKFCYPDGRYMRIFAGERFNESNPLTELIDLKR